jgi:hypothetical protein
MKPYMCVFLSFSILLNACTSISTVSDENVSERPPAANEATVVLLKGGSWIEVEAFHHVDVTEPSDFIYGEGFNMRTRRQFRGNLHRSAIDSITAERGSITCWLEDGASVLFRNSHYVEVTSAEGTGFWCVGQYQNGALFRGRVAHEDIRGFQTGEFDTGNTISGAAIAIGITVAVGLIIYVVAVGKAVEGGGK